MAALGLRRDASALIAAFIGFARWRAAGAAALIALGSVFDGLGLLMLVPVLGLVVGTDARRPGGRIAGLVWRALEDRPPNARLLIVLGGFALLMLVRGEVVRLRDRVTQTLQLEFVEAIRLRVVSRLAAAGWPAAAGANHARLLQALSVEIHQLGVASGAAMLAVVAGAMLAGHGVLALMLSPSAGALAIGFALTAGLISRPFLARSRALGRAIVETHVGMAESAAAFLGGLKLALAQGLGDRFVRGYAAQAASAVHDRVQFQALKSRLANLTTGAAAIAGVSIVFLGVEVFHLAPSVLLTLLVVLSRMGAQAATVQQGVQQVAHSLPAHGAILAIEAELAAGRETAGPPVARPSPAGPSLAGPSLARARPDRHDALVFRGVTYAHAGALARAPDLAQLTLAIRRGAFLGVVGPSGVGKTTFLDLCAGVLRPQAGEVHAFGEALTGEGLARHRERLAYVAQDPFLFDATVRANLAWGAPGRSEAEMRDALEAVASPRLLARLAEGLDTRIGHRGVLLSAGERQRLALACALLRRPRLFLLDEATNAIDPPGEAVILRTLAALRPQATVLMVAHRAESLRCCDEVLEFPGPVLRSAAGADRPAPQKV